MALGDFLKKAAEKGLEMAYDAVEKGKQIVEEQKAEMAKKEEEERIRQEKIAATNRAIADAKKAEEERRRREEKERKKKEMEAILQPTCEKGDCLWNEEKFYFTCPVDCECERKKYTKKDWGKVSVIPEFWPYMKRIEKFGKHYWSGTLDEQREIEKDFMKEFLPQYGPAKRKIAEVFMNDGLGAENLMLNVFFAIKNQPPIKDIAQKIEAIRNHAAVKLIGAPEETKQYFYEVVCKNLSLYNRTVEDCEYTAKLFAVVLNEEESKQYFSDVSNISVEQLYDSDGNIKEAGLGGPQEGFYGDTLWNLVESWSENNSVDDTE